MRLEPRRASSVWSPIRRERVWIDSTNDLPPDVAFLRGFHVSRRLLRDAATRADREGVSAAQALIAHDGVSEALFYRCLADHLGVAFVADWPRLAAPLDPTAALRRGVVRLDDDDRARWLVAPTDENLRVLLKAHARGDIEMPPIAITTPSHLAAIIGHRARATIAYAASQALPDEAPRLSAKGALDARSGVLACLAALACLVGMALGGRCVVDLLGAIFFSAMTFRLLVCCAGLPPEAAPATCVTDADAPFYSVLVALYKEAAMVPRLVEGLKRLDYPRSKLEVMILLETDDRATREALEAQRLPSFFRVVTVPDGRPRTKPRALNVGLMLARGALVTVYDAEDRPDPDQLRKAAARFACAPKSLACLQARLSISNGAGGLLPRLFALEYAALFDLFNIGIGRQGLPMALGGTSNHFRIAALRDVGGWDAWNVTEDADLGLRLARFGYRIDGLDSTTAEEAPETLGVWFKQRRRWTKGWMQTLLVLARDAAAAREFGVGRTLAVAMMLTTLVTGPLLSPIALGLAAWRLVACGMPRPYGAVEIVEATLAISVFALGVASTLWCGYAGMRLRRLDAFFLGLPALLPYQLMISAAAWGGLVDLVLRPYHWRKTDHGASSKRQGKPNHSRPAAPPPRRTAPRRSPRGSTRRG